MRICAIDRNEQFVTYWHVLPPHPHSLFVVTSQEWSEYAGRTTRHIHAWRYPDPPCPDKQGWLPVPSWWREMT